MIGSSARLTVRVLVALLVVPFALNLGGLLYLRPVAVAEQEVLARLLAWGWRLDMLMRTPAAALVVLAAGGLLAAGRRGGRAADVAGLLLAVPLLLLTTLGWLLDPTGAALLLAAASAAVRDRREAPDAGWGAVALALTGLLLAVNLLATNSSGTVVEGLRALAGCPPAPLIALAGAASFALAGGAVALCRRRAPWQPAVAALLLGALWAWRGGVVPGVAAALLALGLGWWVHAALEGGWAALPDPATRPARWPAQLGGVALVALWAVLNNLWVEMTVGPDARPDEIAAEGCAPFDLAASTERVVAVHREQRRVRVTPRQGTPWQVDVQGGDPEEVFHIPDSDRFFVTVVPEELAARAVDLLVIEPGAREARVLPRHVPCWTSSVLWDPTAERVLFGCEARAHLYAMDPGTLQVVRIATLSDEGGDQEDLALRPATDQEPDYLYSVPLATDRQLRRVDLGSAQQDASAPLGGFNYSLLHDPQRDLLWVSRFHDSQVVAVDPQTLRVVDQVRVGFGVRALALLPQQRLLAATSMFHADLQLRSLDDGSLVRRLWIGGQSKGMERLPDGRLLVGTTCGIFTVDPRQ